MKITRRQLRQIIKETIHETRRVQESNVSLSYDPNDFESEQDILVWLVDELNGGMSRMGTNERRVDHALGQVIKPYLDGTSTEKRTLRLVKSLALEFYMKTRKNLVPMIIGEFSRIEASSWHNVDEFLKFVKLHEPNLKMTGSNNEISEKYAGYHPDESYEEGTVKNLMLDKETSHGGWPEGPSKSFTSDKPVNVQIVDWLKDMNMVKR